jgi:hypothetical protein
MKSTLTQSLFFTLFRTSLVLLSGLLMWLAAAATADFHILPITYVIVLLAIGNVFFLCYLVFRRLLQYVQQGNDAGDTITVIRVCTFLLLIAVFIRPSQALNAQSCSCKEYIYLNEPAIGSILKFEVGAPIPLTMLTGANGGPYWYPGSTVSELPSPHGLSTDLNGNLYVGESGTNAYNRKLNCDGVLSPITPTTVFNPGTNQNTFSIGNILYSNTDGGPSSFNTCTGQFLDQLCLTGASGNLWGLSYNPVTERVYATQRAGTQKVWSFSRTQMETAMAANTCIDPIITLGATATINVGDNFLPDVGGQVMGVVGDNSGNIFVVAGFGATSYILKYNAAGQFVAQSIAGPPGSAIAQAIGITWSETYDRLYLSHFTDIATTNCISAIDAQTMAYLGAAAPNPNLPANNQGKAINIVKECCPGTLPAAINNVSCGGVGSKFYLNQVAFNTCNGVVCGTTWTPQGVLNGMTFDECDNSVTITASGGCGTFMLSTSAVSGSGCAAQTTLFTLCSAPATIIYGSGNQTSCKGSTGANAAVLTDANGINSIRFVRFNTDQMVGATPTATEAATIYGGVPITNVTPTGGSNPFTATLTGTAAGWSSLADGVYYVYAIANPDVGASCRPLAEIVVTITDSPQISGNNITVCENSTVVNLTTLITNNNPVGALTFHSTPADATAGTNALINSTVAPTTTTTYYGRSILSTCFSTAPMTVAVSANPAPAVTTGSVCAGGSIDLATLVTSTGGGTLSFYTSQANANAGTNALGSSTVSPTTATNYYVRSTAAGCYGVEEIIVTITPAVCGTPTVTGPN